VTARPELDAKLRDAAALSLHWLRDDNDAVLDLIEFAEKAGPEAVVDMVLSLLALGRIAGDRLGGREAYEGVLAELARHAALAAEGLKP